MTPKRDFDLLLEKAVKDKGFRSKLAGGHEEIIDELGYKLSDDEHKALKELKIDDWDKVSEKDLVDRIKDQTAKGLICTLQPVPPDPPDV